MEKKVILVEYDTLEKILSEIESVKQILSQNVSAKAGSGIQWMNNKELMEYLHVSRRTTLTLRRSGLPYSQVSGGKILYRRDLVDQFISKNTLDTDKSDRLKM
jgi:hypothetical protein